jgi:peptidoglycan/xylan/chitin deacetylase (PgdA/CDA1 family)
MLGKLAAGTAIVLAVSAFGAVTLGPRWVVGGLSRVSPEVLYFVDTDRPAVALTIDDGPDPASTPAILDVLERHGAEATFFLITDRVPGNDEVVRRILDEGHEIANHLTREEPSILLPADTFERELIEAHDVLLDYSAQRWFRPGSGFHSSEMLERAERHGYTTVLGSVYPFDAQIPSASFAERQILANARPGSIIVLHDGGDRGLRTAKALEAVLPELEARGLRVVTLSELVDGP